MNKTIDQGPIEYATGRLLRVFVWFLGIIGICMFGVAVWGSLETGVFIANLFGYAVGLSAPLAAMKYRDIKGGVLR
jgi:hypothetical protein